MSDASCLVPPSSQLELLQLDWSMVVDRSGSDVSEMENLKEFFELTDRLWEDCRLYTQVKGITFHGWLVHKAQKDSTYYSLEPKELNTQVDWKKIPYIPHSLMTNSAVDDLLYVWIQLKRYEYFLDVDRAENEYANLLAATFPRTGREKRDLQKKGIAGAFNWQGRFTKTGRMPSEARRDFPRGR